MPYDFLVKSAYYFFSIGALLFLAEVVYLTMIAPLVRRRHINRRLRVQSNEGSGEQALVRIKEERGILDRDLEFMGGLSKLLVQSGLRMTMARFLTIILLAWAGISAAVIYMTELPSWAGIAIGVVLGVFLPIQIVKFIRKRRQQEFTSQLPDALDIVVRSLRSGHPVQTSMSLVGREMPDPIGSEFGITVDEMTFGLDMPAALNNLANRMGVPDLSLLVTAVSLQSTSGGNLSVVLENLSKVLRDRFQLRRKVRSISAEGRFSAYGLTILPILIALAIYVQNPRYYSDVWHEPMFQLSIVGLVIWQLIGDYMMYKMINFKF